MQEVLGDRALGQVFHALVLFAPFGGVLQYAAPGWAWQKEGSGETAMPRRKGELKRAARRLYIRERGSSYSNGGNRENSDPTDSRVVLRSFDSLRA